MTLLPWNWLSSQCQKKCYGYWHPADDMYRLCPWSSWTIPADIVETWVKNCTARFCNHSIGMRSYFLKSNFKFNLQKHHFVYVYEVIIKCYLNFIICLYFPLALIKWNSIHCHQMELFKSKESCKKLSEREWERDRDRQRHTEREQEWERETEIDTERGRGVGGGGETERGGGCMG